MEGNVSSDGKRIEAELDKLQSDLDVLREHVSNQAHDLGDAAAQRLADEIEKRRARVRAAYQRGEETLERATRDARRRAREGVDTVQHEIEEHPWSSVMVGIGLGIAIGTLLGASWPRRR